jgi:hypothetical protein
MKEYLIVLFFLGIITTIIGYYESNPNCEKQKVEYKFLDKSIEEAQKAGDTSVYNRFIGMFVDPPLLI